MAVGDLKVLNELRANNIDLRALVKDYFETSVSDARTEANRRAIAQIVARDLFDGDALQPLFAMRDLTLRTRFTPTFGADAETKRLGGYVMTFDERADLRRLHHSVARVALCNVTAIFPVKQRASTQILSLQLEALSTALRDLTRHQVAFAPVGTFKIGDETFELGDETSRVALGVAPAHVLGLSNELATDGAALFIAVRAFNPRVASLARAKIADGIETGVISTHAQFFEAYATAQRTVNHYVARFVTRLAEALNVEPSIVGKVRDVNAETKPDWLGFTFGKRNLVEAALEAEAEMAAAAAAAAAKTVTFSKMAQASRLHVTTGFDLDEEQRVMLLVDAIVTNDTTDTAHYAVWLAPGEPIAFVRGATPRDIVPATSARLARSNARMSPFTRAQGAATFTGTVPSALFAPVLSRALYGDYEALRRVVFAVHSPPVLGGLTLVSDVDALDVASVDYFIERAGPNATSIAIPLAHPFFDEFVKIYQSERDSTTPSLAEFFAREYDAPGTTLRVVALDPAHLSIHMANKRSFRS